MSAPKLAQGLEVVLLLDGIAIVNGGHPVLFQGRAANEVLVPLINAFDGVLNASGLAAELKMQVAHVERGLALLKDRDLIEEV